MSNFDAQPLVALGRLPRVAYGLTPPPPPWYRRTGAFVAAGALIAAVGIVVAAQGEPGIDPGRTSGTSAPRSANVSLIATGWIPTPEPPPPAAPPPEAVAPQPENPPPAPRRVVAPPTWEPPQVIAPPPPPPPPPPQLVLRLDNPITAAFVSITNNTQSAVGCVMNTVPTGGAAAMINYSKPDDQFTVVGSAETRVPAGSSVGPATGSSFRLTVTCDNGLSTSLDTVY